MNPAGSRIPARGSLGTPDAAGADPAENAMPMGGAGDRPAEVPRERILRLRQVMPDESPIDLDTHAAMIAYDVERAGSYAHVLRQREATIQVTRDYVESVHRFLDEVRQTSKASG